MTTLTSDTTCLQVTNLDMQNQLECLEKKSAERSLSRPLIVLADHATFHHSRQVRDYVRAHRSQLRVFFLPKRAPEYNPDEQVWNEVKNNRIGKQPVKNKKDLKVRLTSALDSLKQNSQRIISFFHLPDTKYAAGVA